MSIRKELEKRILILDGAIGTVIQQFQLSENDYRNKRFSNWHTQLKGNHDLLTLTQPDLIRLIHTQYLDAGADIIKTNTFNAQAVSMQDYDMESLVYEINLTNALLARQVADKYTAENPAKPRFIAGSVGPTNRSISRSLNTNSSTLKSITFNDLMMAYKEQTIALIQGGVDLLLIETIFDLQNAKAALLAAKKAMEETGRKVEIMVSATISNSDGCIFSGENIQTLFDSISQSELLSIGLNCSFGAKNLKPHLCEMAKQTSCFVSAHPNAGLPNQFGQYEDTSETMAIQIKEYIEEQLVNIVGGCCGTTPDHIAGYSRLVENVVPRKPISEKRKFGSD